MRLTPTLIAYLIAFPALSSTQPIEINIQRNGADIIVDGTINTEASPSIAWAVLTDYIHMAQFIPDLEMSEVSERHDNTLLVHQKGTAH